MGIVANSNTPPGSVGEGWNPGDPDGLELVGFDEPAENRGLPFPVPSPWSGWVEDWNTPNWTSQSAFRINNLVDIAWTCLDLNSNIIASMPVYRTRGGQIVDSPAWMTNPDPTIYSSWLEFAKQLFFDFQMGEAFVLPFASGFDGYPSRFRVMPPWLVNVEWRNGTRQYSFAGRDVTSEILHIRYFSNTTDARGHGPLEAAGARTTAINLLQRYANNLAETGGKPLYWMELERRINMSEAHDLLDTWIETRSKYAGHPAIVGSGAKLNESHSMSAKDMTLMELAQFNESRIAVMLGVPPFLVGLAGASGSLTYSNISDLYDFHFRSALRPRVHMVMDALSGWALPRGQSAELNRDDYTQLPLDKRYAAYAQGIQAGFISPEQVQAIERLQSVQAAQAITGGTTDG